MTCTTSLRLSMLVLSLALIGVLPASAAAKPQAKAKVKVSDEPFLLSGDANDPDQTESAAACPSKTTLLSGGALTNTPAPVGGTLATELFISGPLLSRKPVNAWIVLFDSDTPVDLLPSAQAICLKDELKTTGIEGSPKAISKVKRVNATFALPPDTAATNGIAQFDVACPKGTTIAGGGASYGARGSDLPLMESGPQGNGWHVRLDNDDNEAVSATASAICLKNKLKVEGEGDKARSKFEQVDQTVTLPADGTNDGRARFTVPCPSGTTVTGGGGKIDPAAPLATANFELSESGVSGNAWQVTFDNDDAVAQTATVHALCLKKKLEVS